jgi:3-dehydroquinate synthase
MRTIKLSVPSGICDIYLGESLENLMNYCGKRENKQIVVITDRNVRRHYGERLEKIGIAEENVIEIGLGEENKTLATVQRLYEELLDLEVDRSSFIVGMGGGIVCDVSGFVASTYMRGVEFGFVPTTLLAQVDASVGGKNGVNLSGYKNIVGVIRQPKFCLCDFELLKTLPQQEIRCGFAEIIKHAAIGDRSLFAYLEDNAERALSLHRTTIEKAVHDSLAVKIKIVSLDENEKNERMKLNFGHTIGHAIEKVSKIPHGEAVAAGMIIEAKISVRKGMLQKKDAERLERLIMAYGLPISVMKSLTDAIKKDKKKFGEQIRIPLLDSIGKGSICEVSIEEIDATITDYLERDIDDVC